MEVQAVSPERFVSKGIESKCLLPLLHEFPCILLDDGAKVAIFRTRIGVLANGREGEFAEDCNCDNQEYFRKVSRLFHDLPPESRSRERDFRYDVRARKILETRCHLFEASDSVVLRLFNYMGIGIGRTGVEAANAVLTDEEVVRRVIEGEPALFEILMRRYNQRLFRITRSIVTNDHEAEDIIQDAYVRAYEHLSQFEGRARFSTWLTKIAIYEAYARVRRVDRRRMGLADAPLGMAQGSLDHAAVGREVRALDRGS